MIIALQLLLSVALATPCSDGWKSSSSGSGTCSHHGGIAGGSSGYYPTYIPTYIPTYVTPVAPATMTQPLNTDFGQWRSKKFITTGGQVGYTLNRGLTEVGQYMSAYYTCYPLEFGYYGELLMLVVSPETGYESVETWIASGGEKSAVRVYAVKGNTSNPLQSWEVSIGPRGMLLLRKWTDGITHATHPGGMLFLTQNDLRAIEQSEDIYIFVTSNNKTLDTYKIPMDGFSSAVDSLRKKSCSVL